tara:strand:- start:605 stop:820 length:216 start_codon:yes stop_codon:yes gene_type:complete
MRLNSRYNTKLADKLKDLNANTSLTHFQIAEKYELSINELRYLLYRYKAPQKNEIDYVTKWLQRLKKFFSQ